MLDKIVVYLNLTTMTCLAEIREDIKLSRRKRLDVHGTLRSKTTP